MYRIKVIHNNEEFAIISNFMKQIYVNFPINECKFKILDVSDLLMKKTHENEKISGIYKISRNNKIYIGQSKDILGRWDGHIKQALKESNNSEMHRTMHKHLSEFTFEIIELVKGKEKLNEREIYWIKHFNSFKNGYNQTHGGDGAWEDFKGEKHHNCKTSENIVKEIRILYNEKKLTKREVYGKYKNMVNKRAFDKIWDFSTWKHIYPEFQNKENALWHTTHFNFSGNGNPRKLLNEEQMNEIRKYISKGLNDNDIYEKYFSDFSKPNFMKYIELIKNHTNKEIEYINNEKFTKTYLETYHLTEEDIYNVRQKMYEGYIMKDLIKIFGDKMTKNNLHQIYIGRVCKTIHMDIYEHKEQMEENKKLRKYNLTIEDIKNIRTRYANKENVNDVYEDYKDKLTFGKFHGIWCGYRLKYIMPEVYKK